MPIATATALLNGYWDRKLPVNPTHIAQRLGITVVPELSLVGGASGLIEEVGGLTTIRYDMTEPAVRQRFTVAHELGHFSLKHLNEGQRCFRDTKAQFFSHQVDPRETAANQFAAELLMPREAVEYLVQEHKLLDVSRLANLFHVSEAAMGFRLKNLALAHLNV
ncbi:ImmA/IrrE family metallo-endopeptidase [Alcaligenes aquatilis]|uniref:ImmA/IrrE family metallo-endopeptidase n=1 Tax=Alcaligenes aquatilis TaxID=323284 RepID=A0ABY4NK15_9BURK|nr:ImmA/IrrE family metallo-endopeptidase [Alcaligenes aquatilis]UQN37332.1 ImmA/IrrE family metallo-endopeptidase [Alcaligenes aquatilis]